MRKRELNTIIFNGMDGILINYDDEQIEFINEVLGIDTSDYDKIYKLNDLWSKKYLFIKGDTYKCVKCNYEGPIIETLGILNNFPEKQCIIS